MIRIIDGEGYCPLTLSRITSVSSYACAVNDCSHISKDKWNILYGCKYHCEKEKEDIERMHEKREKDKRLRQEINDSFDITRGLDHDKFHEICDEIDKEMIEKRQEYNRDMQICPYHEDDEKILMYLFEDDKPAEISIVTNIFTYMAQRYVKLLDRGVKWAISYIAIPEYIADAINVNLHLRYKMNVASILHKDNPVYIKHRDVTKYFETVYGMDWHQFNKLKKEHLEITEITNYDNIIYLKKELDDIVCNEAKRD